ncbi:MAG TPA: FxsA family protein [Ornithinibacter sp.]|nr:FxsA family protein [Ornithinibacter sp.]
MSRPGATPYAARRRRPRVLRWVFLALLVVPIIEIAAIIAVGRVIGGWQTLVLLLLESALGAWIVKREGSRTWNALQEALRTGRMPSRQLADAALVLIGGTLLLTPGFVTDIVGFFFILPLTRPITRAWLEAVVARRLLGPMGEWPSPGGAAPRGSGSGSGGPASGSPGPAGPSRGGRPDVIQGEVVDPDSHP